MDPKDIFAKQPARVRQEPQLPAWLDSEKQHAKNNNSYPDSPVMDEETRAAEIQARFDRGGFLVFLDCPRGLQFGFDMSQWTVDTQFMGLKMIPADLWHFVHV